jgi:nitroreductase
VEFREVLRRRRTVRRYTPEPVAPEALERVVEAYRSGPSAGFAQGQHLVVVTRDDLRHALAVACDEPSHVARGLRPWLSVAPVHLVPCVRASDYRRRYAAPDKAGSRGPQGWTVPFWWMDGGAAVMALMLAAVDEGLGTGFLDIADRHRVRGLLRLPDDVEPLGIMTLGHPLPEPPTTSQAQGRRPTAEVLHREQWGSA